MHSPSPVSRDPVARALLAALLAALLLAVAGFGDPWRSEAPAPWTRWQASNEAARTSIDHDAWARLLKRYLRRDPSGLNRFAYDAVPPGDRAALERYLAQLAGLRITGHSRREQLAYWINLYNALTVKVVLDHYPVASIRDIDISPGLLSDGPWQRKLIVVEGQKLSLDDIEHRILRPLWRDPRLHYAVNCASVGCPNLQREPFTAANAERLLERAARQYVNSPRGVAIRDGKVTVSKIYSWFAHDFGNSQAGVLQHLRRYAEPALAAQLRSVERIDATAYDWRLNGR